MLTVKATAPILRKKTIRPPTRKSVPTCLKVPDVAAILGISRVRAYELASSEGFPRIVMGKRIIVPRRAFMDWMETKTVTHK